MSDQEERWLPIPSYEGRYDVSDYGNVRSWKNNRWGLATTPHPLAARVTRRGRYQLVTLRSPERGQDHRLIHRLVLEAFVGPLPEGQITRHLNGDPLDNRLSNLQYGTPRENQLDSIEHGTHPWAARDRCSRGHIYSEETMRLRINRKSGRWGRRCMVCARVRYAMQKEAS